MPGTAVRVAKVIGRRVALAVPLLFVVTGLTFILVSAEPQSIVDKLLGTDGTASEQSAIRHKLGLNFPVYEQYWHWWRHAIGGNLGTSWVSQLPVRTVIGSGLPVTLSLILVGLLVFSVVGVALGVFSAVHGGVAGRIVDGLAMVGFGLPSFWVGAILIAIFAVDLRLLPATGYVSLSNSPGQWLESIALPVVALTLNSIAVLARQTREAMRDVLASEHIRVARATGIAQWRIPAQLALKNAAGMVSTVVGLQAVSLLLGTVFVENLFSLPGLGSDLVTATTQGDLPVVEGITVVFTVIIVLVNLIVDLLYTVLDPRVRTS